MIQHHPDDTTLLLYATGAMPEALKIVVALHLSYCAICRRAIADLELIGGLMLDEIEPEPMSGSRTTAFNWQPPPIVNPTLPAPLNRTPLGARWWPFGVGLRWRPLQITGPAWAGLIWGKPGSKLPRHRHVGIELTCVLEGSFSDGDGEYFFGDVADPQGSHIDPPIIVTGSQPCLCVLASEGMYLQGMLGVLQRPFGFLNGT